MAVTPFKSSDNFNMAGFNEKIAEADNTYIAKTGDSMTGALSMGNNKITDVASPTSAGDAVNKGYVDGIGSEIKNKFNISNEIPVWVVSSRDTIIGTGTVHNYISYSVIDIKNTTQGESIAQLYKSEQIQDEFLLRTAIKPSGNIKLNLISEQNSSAEINKYGNINVSEAVGERSIYVPFLCF
nr:MAG TPA: hyaluronase tail fiber protein [Caudoviricetes sp.]